MVGGRIMNALRPALLSLFVLAPSVPAEAHPQVMKGGHVEDPPGPEKHQDLQQRRAVRGCPVGEPCRGELLRGLHEFELEAFPRPGRDGPWFDGNDPHGHARVRSGLGADDRARRHAVRRPSELRPDLPWLDKLKLPDIPVHWDHRIIKYLEFYRYDPRGRNIMSAWLRDQGKYKHIILKELRRAKLPEALLYIAMIESSYDPHEYSRTGASGLWQFMPASGRIYGMKQDRWLDERNDPVIATKAVTYYFRDLYERFGDWDLALAAFNAGYGAVIKGIAKYNTNDFWTLLELENALPWESARYVPKFLAAAIVGENLQRFGYSDVEVAPPVSWDLVSVGKSTPLKTIAKAAKTTLETIQRLNPQLRRKRTPPGKKSYRVRIPRGAKESFARAIPQLRSEWDDVDAYVVKHGERFEDIAMTHGLSRRKLRAMNGLKSENEVRGGMLLVVPVVSEAEKRENRQKAQEEVRRQEGRRARRGRYRGCRSLGLGKKRQGSRRRLRLEIVAVGAACPARHQGRSASRPLRSRDGVRVCLPSAAPPMSAAGNRQSPGRFIGEPPTE